jgi:hypothetical protein
MRLGFRGIQKTATIPLGKHPGIPVNHKIGHPLGSDEGSQDLDRFPPMRRKAKVAMLFSAALIIPRYGAEPCRGKFGRTS